MRTETRVGVFVIGAIAVFLYLSFNMGVFRVDHRNFNEYTTYFDDITGLDVKAGIKSAGVRIGWVAAITLRPGGRAEVLLKINKAYPLALNAYATIQQDSLIGQKYIEIDRGDASTGTLAPGGTFVMPGKSSVNFGELIDQFKEISQNVADVTQSLRAALASKAGRERLRQIMTDVAKSADNMAKLTASLHRTVEGKEYVVKRAIDDAAHALHQLQEKLPKLLVNFDGATRDLREKVFPEVAKMGPAFEAVEDTAIQAREGFREAEQIMEKINSGKGVIGKLINEDETYADLKKTVHGLKEYVSRMQSVQMHVDMHNETLLKNTEGKGYFELKIRPSHDYFYQFQIASDEFGKIKREAVTYQRYDEFGNKITISDLESRLDQTAQLRDYLEFPEKVDRVTREKNTYHVGMQFGKRFNKLALRVGLFEGSVGGACDFYVPLKSDLFHWITTIEAFDFRGLKRLDDTRPHIKWINRIFFLKNIYTCFGIDDIISRRNARPFFGSGIRFSDADLKYFFSLFAGLGKGS